VHRQDIIEERDKWYTTINGDIDNQTFFTFSTAKQVVGINLLTQHVTSEPSMSIFRGCFKAFPFRRSFPWLSLQHL